MTEPESPSPEQAAPPAAAPRPRTRWWHHWKAILVGLVVTPLLGFALFAYTTLHWSYSEGDRAGTLQKFSHKGWLCKTWEGELMQPTAPGTAPTIWTFSVRNDSVAQLVNAGLGKRVVVSYQEHKGVPTTCFGETPYYVRAIRIEP